MLMLLEMAILKKDVRIMRVLLEEGTIPVSVGAMNLNPLVSASTNGFLEGVKLLVNQGADVCEHCPSGYTCLLAAVQNKHWDVVSYLLNNCCCDVNALGEEGYNPLHYVVLLRRPTMVVELLCNGADLNAKTKNGRTAVYLAVEIRSLNSLKALLENGADPNIETERDCEGLTRSCALHEAVSQGNIEFVKLLVKHGANITKTRSDGLTPLAIALSLHPPRPDIVESLSDASMLNREMKKLISRCELIEQMLREQKSETEKQVSMRVDAELQIQKLQSDLEKYSNRTERAEQMFKALLSEVEDCICCPITCTMMEDPVIAADGHTYEREAIEQWLGKKKESPVTRQALRSSLLMPHLAVKKLMKRYNQEH
eukprot:g6622.t1